MKDEANIVEQYAGSDVGARIDILIKYYPNFIRLVEGFERSLSFIIKQEKEMQRRTAIFLTVVIGVGIVAVLFASVIVQEICDSLRDRIKTL